MRSGRSLGVVICAVLVGCTGSENQLFTPVAGQVRIPDAGKPGKDASVAADGGGLDAANDDDAGPLLRVNPGLDPDATFLWTETQPGHPGACEPGTYTGGFQCTFGEDGDFEVIVGSLEVALGAPKSDQLTIGSGRMLGFADGTKPVFSAALEGALDCADASFAAVTKDSKTYAFPLTLDGSLHPMHIDGALDGDFDAESLVIEGDVTLTTSAGWHCAGKFHAQLAR